LQSNLPKFPYDSNPFKSSDVKFWWSAGPSAEFVEKRQARLQTYFSALASMPYVAEDVYLLTLLGLGANLPSEEELQRAAEAWVDKPQASAKSNNSGSSSKEGELDEAEGSSEEEGSD